MSVFIFRSENLNFKFDYALEDLEFSVKCVYGLIGGWGAFEVDINQI